MCVPELRERELVIGWRYCGIFSSSSFFSSYIHCPCALGAGVRREGPGKGGGRIVPGRAAGLEPWAGQFLPVHPPAPVVLCESGLLLWWWW